LKPACTTKELLGLTERFGSFIDDDVFMNVALRNLLRERVDPVTVGSGGASKEQVRLAGGLDLNRKRTRLALHLVVRS
jgi:hypothetical protein